MKLLEPENKDYAAYVVKLPNPVKLPGLDQLVGLPMMGTQALVDKDVDYGELALVFTAGTQLSEEFAYKNNLHRQLLLLLEVIMNHYHTLDHIMTLNVFFLL